MSGRWIVVLCNAGGAEVTRADFSSEEEMLVYRQQADVTAKEIGGWVDVIRPGSEEPETASR